MERVGRTACWDSLACAKQPFAWHVLTFAALFNSLVPACTFLSEERTKEVHGTVNICARDVQIAGLIYGVNVIPS